MDESLDYAPCGYLSFTNDGKIASVNSTLLELLGYSREELADAPVKKILSASGNIFYQTHFFPLLKLQGRVEELYLPIRNSAGEEIPVLVNAIKSERQEKTFYDCTFMSVRQRNIYENELRQAQKAAESANRAKEDFLSTISHDLRTPLGSILGWTTILKGRESDVELVKKGLAVIERSATAQKSLVDDVLDFARMSSGKMRIEMEPITLEKIIQNSIEIVSTLAAAKDVSLDFRIKDNPTVNGDATRLQQVMWNLLSNAIKFTKAGGSVTVELFREDNLDILRVSDTGKGIAPDFLPNVFNRFQQESDGSSREHEGVGLGLAITKHIVELHDGTIHAESDGEGKGSTFVVQLPILSHQ